MIFIESILLFAFILYSITSFLMICRLNERVSILEEILNLLDRGGKLDFPGDLTKNSDEKSE